MHYELDILETLVFDKLKPSIASDVSIELLEECKAIAITEKSKIKKNFIKAVFELKDNQLIEFYIHNHQNRLIYLADCLYDYISVKDPIFILPHQKINLLSVQKDTYFFITELLSFLEKRFPRYLNQTEKTPEGLKFVTIHEFRGKLYFLEKFTNKTNELLAIALEPIKKFNASPGEITFSELCYLKELITVCLEYVIQGKEHDIHNYLTKKLIFLNFNAISFFYYITDNISTSINALDSLTDKIDKLSWYLKEINQTQMSTEFCYNKSLRSIKKLLGEWIIEEICYFEKSFNLTVSGVVSPQIAVKQDFKITTDLSVSQLAFLLKVFVDTEVIKSQSDKELIRFIASIVQSKRTERISSESLRTKYYNTEENIKDDVKHLLIKMLNYVQKVQ